MKVYKEKQYLVFDYENGKNVKYDFATKTAIGLRGKPVKNLKTQLSNITMDTIIDCCEDKKYAKFLDFVRCKYSNGNYDIYNIGTILSKVPLYSNYEQIFSAGIEDIISGNFEFTINDIPHALLKVAKNKKNTNIK